MSYNVKNTGKTTLPLVCTLKDKSPLFLYKGESKVVSKAQMTDHLESLSKDGFVIITEVEEKPNKKKLKSIEETKETKVADIDETKEEK